MHLLRELLLPFELPLPELDTLSDLLIDFLVGSNSRSNIWRIVLCLRLNGLVYILFFLWPFSFKMEFFLDLRSRSIIFGRERSSDCVWNTVSLFLFFLFEFQLYVSQIDMMIECLKLTLHRSNLARMIAKRHLPALYMHNVRYPSVKFGKDRLEALYFITRKRPTGASVRILYTCQTKCNRLLFRAKTEDESQGWEVFVHVIYLLLRLIYFTRRKKKRYIYI